MGFQVVSGAVLMCSFGVAPSTLTVLPTNQTMVANMPAANIMDNIPFVNIMSFSMCTSLSNPTVASATSAALGVLTPMACTPVIPAPWSPGVPTTLIANQPAVNDTCMLNCAYAGVITVTYAGQVQTQV